MGVDGATGGTVTNKKRKGKRERERERNREKEREEEKRRRGRWQVLGRETWQVHIVSQDIVKYLLDSSLSHCCRSFSRPCHLLVGSRAMGKGWPSLSGSAHSWQRVAHHNLPHQSGVGSVVVC